jgi:membrane-associated phospholipid phosphatase
MKVFFKHPVLPFTIILLLFFPLIFINKEHTLLFINGSNSDFLDLFFKKITWFGEGIMILISVLLLVFKKYKWLFIFLVALIMHVFLIQFNKQILFNHLNRPLCYMTAVDKVDLLHLVDGLIMREEVSFPSGHTTNIAFTSTFIALLFKRKRLSIFLAVFAFTVGISRVYLAQHFFIDIYFGYLFGFFSSVCAYLIVNRFATRFNFLNKYILPKRILIKVNRFYKNSILRIIPAISNKKAENQFQ